MNNEDIRMEENNMKCNYIEYHRLTDQMFYGAAPPFIRYCLKTSVY